MEYKICTLCGKNKKITRYYANRNQCKRCYIAKRKYTTDNVTQDVDDAMQKLDISPSTPNDENVGLREEISNMNTAMNYFQQITAKLENTVQEMEEKIGLISDENTRLHDKVGELETENTKLRNDIDMTQYRMDHMDENLSNNVSTSVDLCDKTRELYEVNDKVNRHCKMQTDVSNIFYQFIMETVTKDDVMKQLDDAGYLKKDE
jgi:chromosome segregation ATPase